ncbi:TPA: injection protein [Klebsiella oxytoca]|uniref:Injection protein n=1 Tax=Klebsiella oxytoca TaxID=571 RepID=A0AAN5RG06_KLEOX|nr:injection protein [Klebsiella oxytoca]
MAKAWKDVISSQQYQVLTPQQQADAQEQYFNEVVAPQAGDKAKEAKQAFYTAYPIPTQEAQPAPTNDGSLASGFAQLATQQKEGLDRSAEQGASLGAAMREAVTGENRMTPELERLQNVGSAPELNAFSTDALRAGIAQLFGSDASQEKILQSMGATLSQDEKGNTIVRLPSGSYALNKPGISPQDVTSFLANALAFTPAARAGTVLGATAKSGATDLALQGATQAAGGESVDPVQTALSAGLGGAMKGLENTVSAAARSSLGKIAPEKQAQIDFAKQNNLPLMTTDVVPPETNVGKQARTLTERIPFAGTGGLRSSQQSARENLVRTFSDGVGGISDAQLYNSATKGQQQFIQAAGKRYDRIINAMGDTPVDITNTVKAIDRQIARITRPGASQDRAAVNVLQQFKDDITSGPNNLQLARENRTNLRKRFMAAPDEVDRDILEKAAQSVYDAYTQDMKKAVAGALGSQEAMNMARVDRSWAKFNDMMSNTRVQKALRDGRTTPEDVTKLIFSQSPAERSQLYRLLDDNGRQNARGAIVQRAVDKATDASGNISVEKFINEMHRNRKQAGTFFRGEHGRYLDGVIKYLDSTREAATGAASPLTGQLMAGPAALASLLNPIAAKAVAIGAGAGLAGRAYESKVLRNAMLKLANTPKGSTAYDRAISKVSETLSPIAQASSETAQQ